MTELKYVIVDVFAEAALRGNPAAIVFDADGLTEAQMQALGRSPRHESAADACR